MQFIPIWIIAASSGCIATIWLLTGLSFLVSKCSRSDTDTLLEGQIYGVVIAFILAIVIVPFIGSGGALLSFLISLL